MSGDTWLHVFCHVQLTIFILFIIPFMDFFRIFLTLKTDITYVRKIPKKTNPYVSHITVQWFTAAYEYI